MVLAGSMVTAAMFGYISASPFLLQDGFGLSAQWFSACFALNAIGIVAGHPDRPDAAALDHLFGVALLAAWCRRWSARCC